MLSYNARLRIGTELRPQQNLCLFVATRHCVQVYEQPCASHDYAHVVGGSISFFFLFLSFFLLVVVAIVAGNGGENCTTQ